jgi:hypothetical protein
MATFYFDAADGVKTKFKTSSNGWGTYTDVSMYVHGSNVEIIFKTADGTIFYNTINPAVDDVVVTGFGAATLTHPQSADTVFNAINPLFRKANTVTGSTGGVTDYSQLTGKPDLYVAQTVAAYAAALTAATGTVKKIITVTSDENSGGSNVKYFYDGVNGTLTPDFDKLSSTYFDVVGGETVIKDSKINSLIASYLSANGYAPGGGGANAAPVASSVAFTGTPTQGQTLTGTYTYSDAESNAEGTSIKKWYRSDNTSALNRVAISGATAATYVLQAADVGKYIQFAVTPVASAGTTTGTEVFSAYSAVIASSGASETAMTNPTTITNFTQSTNTYTSNANGAFLSFAQKIASGATGYFQMITDVVGESGLLGVTSNNANQLPFEIPFYMVANSSGVLQGKFTDGNTYAVTGTGASPVGTLVRIYITATQVIYRVSENGGTTWTSDTGWTMARPAGDIYVKGYAATTGLKIKNLVSFNAA